MRGTACHRVGTPAWDRIIPAHAGNSLASVIPMACNNDHPRSCGEQSPTFSMMERVSGSPPLMRGTEIIGGCVKVLVRITHAHAGNRQYNRLSDTGHQDHPRSCGEQVVPSGPVMASTGSPPLMRGTEVAIKLWARSDGITPAHAGNSCPECARHTLDGDHPRSCGEQLA